MMLTTSVFLPALVMAAVPPLKAEEACEVTQRTATLEVSHSAHPLLRI
jgi:hypothetical protein